MLIKIANKLWINPKDVSSIESYENNTTHKIRLIIYFKGRNNSVHLNVKDDKTVQNIIDIINGEEHDSII